MRTERAPDARRGRGGNAPARKRQSRPDCDQTTRMDCRAPAAALRQAFPRADADLSSAARPCAFRAPAIPRVEHRSTEEEADATAHRRWRSRRNKGGKTTAPETPIYDDADES